MYACKIVASTHVDALQVIWSLERVEFDGAQLDKFERLILIVNPAKILTFKS